MLRKMKSLPHMQYLYTINDNINKQSICRGEEEMVLKLHVWSFLWRCDTIYFLLPRKYDLFSTVGIRIGITVTSCTPWGWRDDGKPHLKSLSAHTHTCMLSISLLALFTVRATDPHFTDHWMWLSSGPRLLQISKQCKELRKEVICFMGTTAHTFQVMRKWYSVMGHNIVALI